MRSAPRCGRIRDLRVVHGTCEARLAFAKVEASEPRSPALRPEHLLLGLLREAEPVVVMLFEASGVAPDDLVAEIRRRAAPAADDGQHPIEVAISREAQQVLAYAVERCVTLGHADVRGEHILLGLMTEEAGLACRVLLESGMRTADLQVLVEAVHRDDGPRHDRAIDLLDKVARSLGPGPVSFVSTERLHAITAAFEDVVGATWPMLAFFADRSGIVVSEPRIVPPLLAVWLDTVGIDPGRDRGLIELLVPEVVTPGERPACVAWVGGDLVLAVVAGAGVPGERLRASVERFREVVTWNRSG
ncbi:MAG: Clp protease N-terminal domain-containing protein [Acidobacteriota bacterium]